MRRLALGDFVTLQNNFTDGGQQIEFDPWSTILLRVDHRARKILANAILSLNGAQSENDRFHIAKCNFAQT